VSGFSPFLHAPADGDPRAAITGARSPQFNNRNRCMYYNLPARMGRSSCKALSLCGNKIRGLEKQVSGFRLLFRVRVKGSPGHDRECSPIIAIIPESPVIFLWPAAKPAKSGKGMHSAGGPTRRWHSLALTGTVCREESYDRLAPIRGIRKVRNWIERKPVRAGLVREPLSIG